MGRKKKKAEQKKSALEKEKREPLVVEMTFTGDTKNYPPDLTANTADKTDKKKKKSGADPIIFRL